MTKLILAVTLSMPAAAALPVSTLVPRAALPAFNVIAAPESRTPARDDAAFPSTQKLLGDSADPLSSLLVAGEELRDSLNAIPTGEALKIGLRDHNVNVRLASVRDAAYPRDVAAVPSLAGVMLRLDQPPNCVPPPRSPWAASATAWPCPRSPKP